MTTKTSRVLRPFEHALTKLAMILRQAQRGIAMEYEELSDQLADADNALTHIATAIAHLPLEEVREADAHLQAEQEAAFQTGETPDQTAQRHLDDLDRLLQFRAAAQVQVNIHDETDPKPASVHDHARALFNEPEQGDNWGGGWHAAGNGIPPELLRAARESANAVMSVQAPTAKPKDDQPVLACKHGVPFVYACYQCEDEADEPEQVTWPGPDQPLADVLPEPRTATPSEQARAMATPLRIHDETIYPNEAEFRCGMLMDEIRTSELDKQALQKEVDRLTNELRSYEVEVDAYKRNHRITMQQLDMRRSVIKSLKDRVSEHCREIEQLVTERDALKVLADARQEHLDKLAEEAAELRSTTNVHIDKAMNQREQADRLGVENENLRQRIYQLANEKRSLQDTLATYKVTVRLLNRELGREE